MADYHPQDEPVWETENFGFDNADNVWNVGDASMLDRENWGDGLLFNCLLLILL